MYWISHGTPLHRSALRGKGVEEEELFCKILCTGVLVVRAPEGKPSWRLSKGRGCRGAADQQAAGWGSWIASVVPVWRCAETGMPSLPGELGIQTPSRAGGVGAVGVIQEVLLCWHFVFQFQLTLSMSHHIGPHTPPAWL